MKHILVSAGLLLSALLLATSCNPSNRSDHVTDADSVMNTPPPMDGTATTPPADTIVPRSNINSDTPMQAQ